METQTLYYLLAGLLILIGLVGVVLPALPGLPLAFAGMWLAAWAGDFEQIGVVVLVVLGLLTLLSVAVDLLATLFGARRVGASRLALVGAAVGTIVGLLFGILGIFIGPFVGALIGEFLHGRRIGQAARVGFGTWLGIVLGTAFNLALAFAMLGLFAFAWWW